MFWKTAGFPLVSLNVLIADFDASCGFFDATV